MSGDDGRKLSTHIIQLVQNRVERCLQHYMNKKEVISTLIIQDNIEPRFTELVWQRLEEENQEFFKAYYLKLLVKDQIMEFNRLLSEQVELMRRIELTGISPMLTPNGSQITPAQEISTPCTVQHARHLTPDDMRQKTVFHNGSVDEYSHTMKIDVSPNMFLPQNSNMGMVKTESVYAGSCSPFDFSPNTNYLEARPLMIDASVSSFSSIESNTQHLNDALLDGDDSSLRYLTQNQPQSFNLPDLATDFNSNNDLLESFCRAPFLETDVNNFVGNHGSVSGGDIERLDPATARLRYQCFGGQ